MIVAVDYQSTQGKKTGIGAAAANLIPAIERRDPSIKLLKYVRPDERDLNTPRRILWESWEIPARVKRDNPDLVYSPGFAPAFRSPKPQVVTVHDLIGMMFPSNQAGAAKFYWSYWLPACVRRAKTVVASSESTKRDIVRLLKIDEKKIEVVPLGANAPFRRLADSGLVEETKRRFGLGRPYFLAVGTLEPRKNHANLIRAFDAFRRKNPDAPMLAVAGKDAGEKGKLQSLVSGLRLDAHVKFLDYVPDDDLTALYNSALGYAYVSHYEGFGFPPLEAMCCGVSGVLSSASSTPEIGGDAALYADPSNVAEIADRLEVFYRDAKLREELAAKAFERSKLFSWDKTADRMIDIFKRSV